MKNFKDYIHEMAKPTSEDIKQTYYHGTSSLEKVKSIKQHGLLPWNTEIIKVKSQYPVHIQPMKNMVYLTKSLNIALGYSFHIFGEDPPAKGYLLQVEGKQLTDIYPDEDEVGQLLTSNDETDEYDDELQKIKSYFKPIPFNSNIAKYGKNAIQFLMKNKDENMIRLILQNTKNISNQGKIIPIHCYEFEYDDLAFYQHGTFPSEDEDYGQELVDDMNINWEDGMSHIYWKDIEGYAKVIW